VFILGKHGYVGVMAELTWAQEVENVVVPASIQEDAEGLARKVALLKGELVKACQA
jgi:hypothetical protein